VSTVKDTLRRVAPPWLWDGLRKARQTLTPIQRWYIKTACRDFAGRNPREFQRALEEVGYLVVRSSDYYSPLPSVTQLQANAARWNRPSALHAVSYDVDGMKAMLDGLLGCYLKEFLACPDYAEVQQMGFGPGYTAVDALTLYMMIRHLKPRRYIEVGSGVSTYYCSLAAQRNAADGHPLKITCIEPYPYEKLSTIRGVEVLQKKVEEVDVSVFRALEENDVLFIDSSHVLRIDGDVPFLFLEVLPVIHRGVAIHVHDIPFPYNVPYPSELWVFAQEWPMFWNEAMMLQAFLTFNPNFEIVLSTPLIRHLDEDFLKQRVPIYETVAQNPNTFSSIWLRRSS
jgi:predicted O-methyltransferase YrrM